LIKTPIPENEKERLSALHNYAILDSSEEYEFDRITKLASLICDTPISLISFIDEKRQWFKSIRGLSGRQTYRDLSFCQYTIMGNVLLEVNDALMDKRFSKAELVLNDPNIRFYAGYPLVDASGFALGSLAVVDYKPRALTSGQQRSLKLLAGEIIALLAERRKKEELKHFEKIFRLSNDLICISNATGSFKTINPSFKIILGWDEEFMLRSSVFDLVHPDDMLSTRQELHRLAGGWSISQYTHRLRTLSGQYKYI
jgi:PAS domain S-box-containing protein